MRKLAFAAVLSCVAAGASMGTPTIAATLGMASVVGFTGSTQSSVAGCPYILWRLVNRDNGEVVGIAYHSDLSGLSTVHGTMDQSGHFKLTLTSVLDKGPVGTASGTRTAEGAIDATLTGEGCANSSLHMVLANLNQYHLGGGAPARTYSQ